MRTKAFILKNYIAIEEKNNKYELLEFRTEQAAHEYFKNVGFYTPMLERLPKILLDKVEKQNEQIVE